MALVTDAFGGHGGIALYNRDVLNSLCLHQDVTEVVAIPRSATQHEKNYPDQLTYDLSGLGSGLAYIKTVSKYILSGGKFNLILCCHINLMPIAWLIGRLFNIPVILEIYGIEAWNPRGRWLAEKLSAKAQVVISISDYTRVRYLSWSKLDPKLCKILPNAIHMEEYSSGEKPQYLLDRYGIENKEILLTLGRIVSKERAKGFDEVLDVLPDLIKHHPNIVYVVAGDGEYLPALRKKVERQKLKNHVLFTGMVEESEKADHYRLADVYVMPSRGEGFGFVFLEALACGTPVIASKVDGSREAVLDGQLGAVVHPDKPDEIKQAILRALTLPKEVPEKLNYFSFNNFSSRLHDIINDTMHTKEQA